MSDVNSSNYSDPASVVDEAKRDLQAASQLLHQSQIYDDLRALESPATLSAQSSVTELSLIHNLAQARNKAEAAATHEPVERSLLVVAGGVTDDVALRIVTIQRGPLRQMQADDEGTEDSASTSVQFDVNIRVLTPDTVDYSDSRFDVSRPFVRTADDEHDDQRMGNRVEIIRALSPVSVISSDVDVESSTASFYTACQTITSSTTNRREDASNDTVPLLVALKEQTENVVDELGTASVTDADEFYTLSDGDSTATPLSDVDESEFHADPLLQVVLKDASDAFCDGLSTSDSVNTSSHAPPNPHCDDDTLQLSSDDELEPPEIDDPQLAVTRADILEARRAQLRHDVQLVNDEDVIDESLLEIDREIERKLRETENADEPLYVRAGVLLECETPTSSRGELVKLADDSSSASGSSGDEDLDSKYVVGGAPPQRTVRSPPPEVDEAGDSALALNSQVAAHQTPSLTPLLNDLTATIAKKPKTLGLPIVRVPIAQPPPMSSISECDDESTTTSITNPDWTIEPTLVSSLQALTAFDDSEELEEPPQAPSRRSISFTTRDPHFEKPLPPPPVNDADQLEESGAESGSEIELESETDNWHKHGASTHAQIAHIDAEQAEEGYVEDDDENVNGDDGSVTEYENEEIVEQERRKLELEEVDGDVEQEETELEAYHEYANFDTIKKYMRHTSHNGEVVYENGATFDQDEEQPDEEQPDEEQPDEEQPDEEQLDEEQPDEEQPDEDADEDEQEIQETNDDDENEGQYEVEDGGEEIEEEVEEQEDDEAQQETQDDEHLEDEEDLEIQDGHEEQNEEENQEDIADQEVDEGEQQIADVATDADLVADDEAEDAQDQEDEQYVGEAEEHQPIEAKAEVIHAVAPIEMAQFQNSKMKDQFRASITPKRSTSVQSSKKNRYLPNNRYDKPLPPAPSTADPKSEYRADADDGDGMGDNQPDIADGEADEPPPPVPRDYCNVTPVQVEHLNTAAWHSTSADVFRVEYANAPIRQLPVRALPSATDETAEQSLIRASSTAQNAAVTEVEQFTEAGDRREKRVSKKKAGPKKVRNDTVPSWHSVSTDFFEMHYANAAIFQLPLRSSPLTAEKSIVESEPARTRDDYQPSSFAELDQPAETNSSMKTKKKTKRKTPLSKIKRNKLTNSWNSQPADFIEVEYANTPILQIPSRVLRVASAVNTEESMRPTSTNELNTPPNDPVSTIDAVSRKKTKKKQIAKKSPHGSETVLIEAQSSTPIEELHLSPQLPSLSTEITVDGRHQINISQQSTADVALLSLADSQVNASADANIETQKSLLASPVLDTSATQSLTKAPEVRTAAELHVQANHEHPVASASTVTSSDSADGVRLDDNVEGIRGVELEEVHAVMATRVQLLGHSVSPIDPPETDKTDEFDYFDVLHAGNMSCTPLTRALSQSTESLFIEMQPFVDGDLHCLSVLIGKKLASFKRLLTEPAALGRHGRVLAACLCDLLCHGAADHEAFLDSLLRRHALLTCLLVGQLDSICTTISHAEVLADSDHSRRDVLCAATLARLTNDPISVASCSKLARVGSNLYGCGILLFVFLSERAAQRFVQPDPNAHRAPIDSTVDTNSDGQAQLFDAGPFVVYLSVKHTKTYLTRAVGRQLDALADLCSSYDVDTQYVCAVLLLDRTADLTWRGATAWRVTDLCIRPTSCRAGEPTSEKLNGDADCFATTPILLATGDDSDADEDEVERRKAFVRDVQLALRQYNVSLRHSFPEVHARLVKFIATGKPFVPTIVRFSANRNSALNGSSTCPNENTGPEQCEYACAISCEKLPVVRITQPSVTQRKPNAKTKASSLLLENTNHVNGMPASHSSGADMQAVRVTDL